ncbi:nitronate monooxygenase family protein [Roseomonas sp. 18066]|uniref:NAD(P)H-dependent flavin oxidoreductase n=1 Tax=Roseomonas sp. 18066 TaxID=2681412 RepID=UPI0013592F38|nr:nitronate monooxygenase family protein [Roseomonas sp. 18066]
MWKDRRLLELFGITQPILLAPMAGPGLAPLAIGVAEGGGLPALPCALLTLPQVEAEFLAVRARHAGPLNLNFFCHVPPVFDAAREQAWRARLAPYFAELGLPPDTPIPASNRAPFDAEACALVETLRPSVVSFHFGLPEAALLARVKATGARVIASATTVAEARFLEAQGCDAIIAQGAEAGGHRGVFLADDPVAAVASQPTTLALVPQVVDAVSVPVIAAGGIADGRGLVAALALGAAGVQIGTAFLHTPEARVPAPHRAALREAADDQTALTNLFTGRPARGILNRLMREHGPLQPAAPAFPLAGGALTPLRGASEPQGSGDFMSLWAGQAFRLGRAMPAAALTKTIAAEAQALLQRLSVS